MTQRFGLIKNNTVTNVIISEQSFIDTLPDTWLALSANQGTGWYYDETNTLVAPAPEPPPEPEDPTMVLAKKIALDRYKIESQGITWTDPAGDIWYIDTAADSQARVTGAESAVIAGIRAEGGNWKTAKLNTSTGKFELTFRPTSNAEVSIWASLVHAHVQTCFEVESVCLTKVKNALAIGDYDAASAVTYADEYAAYIAAV